MKYCFIVLVLGYWGRVKTLKTAAETCFESGGGKTEKTVIKLVYGDDMAEVNSNGMLLYDHHWEGEKMTVETQVIDIGNGLTLGSLMKMS